MDYKPIPTNVGVGFSLNSRVALSEIYTEIEKFGKFYYLVRDFSFNMPSYRSSLEIKENIIICSAYSSFLDNIRALSISSVLSRLLPKNKVYVKISDDYGLIDIFDKNIIINPESFDAKMVNIGKVNSDYKYSKIDIHFAIFDMLCYKHSNIIHKNIRNLSELYFSIIGDIKNKFHSISEKIEPNYKLKVLSQHNSYLLGFGCYDEYYRNMASENKIHIFIKYSLEFCKRILRRLEEGALNLSADLHWTIEECLSMLESHMQIIFGSKLGSYIWETI